MGGWGSEMGRVRHVERRLRDVQCPQCKRDFRLSWDGPVGTLVIRECPSGGIYDVAIKCPYCDYREEL